MTHGVIRGVGYGWGWVGVGGVVDPLRKTEGLPEQLGCIQQTGMIMNELFNKPTNEMNE